MYGNASLQSVTRQPSATHGHYCSLDTERIRHSFELHNATGKISQKGSLLKYIMILVKDILVAGVDI